MSKDFNKMSNKELQQYCEDNSIKVEARNVSKPTKAEFLVAIESVTPTVETVTSIDDVLQDEGLENPTVETYDDVDEFLDISEPETTKKASKPSTKKETRAQKRKTQWGELMQLKRVIINANEKSQTLVKNQVEFSTWGNRLLGHHTDRFVLGKPWHVREGALRNLRNMKTSKPIQDEEGNTIKFETVPAYVIQELEPLSKNEIETIAKRQLIRSASIESLV